MRIKVVQLRTSLAIPMTLLAIVCFALLPACNRQQTAAPPQSAPATASFVAIEQAPKPEGPLPKDATCITPACHARYKTAAHIHGPVSVESCQACHQSDQGGHRFPLVRTGAALCGFCHVVSGTKEHQHLALQQAPATMAKADFTSTADAAGGARGGCLNCHDPHISKSKFLLVSDTIDALCAKCHNVPLKKHAHEPFAKGQCTVCHQPHQADTAALLRNGSGPEHCFGCHAAQRVAINQSPHVHKAAADGCTTCHSPHATDFAKQLKEPVNDTCLKCHTKIKEALASSKHVHGAVTDGNGCANCHDAHASTEPAELKARTDKVCLSCHVKAVRTADGRTIAAMGSVLGSRNLHGPVKAGNCSECHQPHAADQPNLLTLQSPDTFYASFDVMNYSLCFSCHEQQMVLRPKTANLTGFRDGERNLHYLHVNRADKGRTCKSCHDVHGSDLPNHMAASVPFEGSQWAMPMNYQTTPTGGTCTPGCHAEKSYNRNPPAGTQPANRGEP